MISLMGIRKTVVKKYLVVDFSGTNTSVLRMNVHFGDRFENAFFDGIGFYFGDG